MSDWFGLSQPTSKSTPQEGRAGGLNPSTPICVCSSSYTSWSLISHLRIHASNNCFLLTAVFCAAQSSSEYQIGSHLTCIWSRMCSLGNPDWVMVDSEWLILWFICICLCSSSYTSWSLISHLRLEFYLLSGSNNTSRQHRRAQFF